MYESRPQADWTAEIVKNAKILSQNNDRVIPINTLGK